MRDDRNDLRNQVLAALRRMGPMTADECADAIGSTPLSLRPRFSELFADDRIDTTGVFRNNASGRPANVWKVL